jgi:electron-transferring-flavoprotein dehydrogenase
MTGEHTPPERDRLDVDVVVAGGGPAGLATAIRLKQIAPDLNVVVLEKGSEVGAHILSGAVIDPIGLDTLLPDWREDPERPLRTEVTDDRFLYLGPGGSVRLPHRLMPPNLSNEGCFIGSLADVTRFLARRAEALGVEIYPGFPAVDLLWEGGSVSGVVTGDLGVSRDGSRKPNYTPGMELAAKYTVIAEGVRGQLAKVLIRKFELDRNCQPQKFGIGLKELWRVRPGKVAAGLVQHTLGWPLDNSTGGGSFLYGMEDGLVSVGFVVHLNYANPYLSPFDEFQRFKTHPAIAPLFEGGERLAYGSRAISEGGFQSVPQVVFPGGALVGDSAGFVNVPRIKGSHNAILSGMLCAEAIAAAIVEGRQHDELAAYEKGWRRSAIGRDLKPVRNVKPLWSKFGTLVGAGLGGLDMWAQRFGVSPFGTIGHGKPDYACLKPAAKSRKIDYPKPDGVLTFDRLSSVFLSNTNHEEDQPVHLRLTDPTIPIRQNLPIYAEPAQRYCPAAVYEVVGEGEDAAFVINAQNCVHCKTCDIKDPAQNITWVAPEGGGGPNYSNM